MMEQTRIIIDFRTYDLKPVDIEKEALGIVNSQKSDVTTALHDSFLNSLFKYMRNMGAFEDNLINDLKLPNVKCFDDLGKVNVFLFKSNGNKDEKFKKIAKISYKIPKAGDY
ncbi:MAG: hypothetical protein QME12_07710 [Nanoarchaeota archaeon]|nr:hypothetical protein [Nanoarchaeota archaeon]